MKSRLIVLMYHRVNDALPPGEWVVGVEAFRQQMNFLKQKCDVVDLKDVLKKDYRLWTIDYGSERPRVVITFDDGYRDNYLNAYPILKELGLSATVFLITGLIGTDKTRPRYKDMPKPDMLNWDEVGEMARNGITFGPHTVSHPHLAELSYQEQEEEISKSIAMVKGEQIFCYPYGEYNKDTMNILREFGIKLAFAMEPGFNEGQDPLQLKRIGVHGKEDMASFASKLKAA